VDQESREGYLDLMAMEDYPGFRGIVGGVDEKTSENLPCHYEHQHSRCVVISGGSIDYSQSHEYNQRNIGEDNIIFI